MLAVETAQTVRLPSDLQQQPEFTPQRPGPPVNVVAAVSDRRSALGGRRYKGEAIRQAERRSALQGAVPNPGKIVFVCRKTPPAPVPPRSDHAAFPEGPA